MKKLIFTLCSVALTLGLSLNAQEGKSKSKTKTDQEVGQTDNVAPDTKASYVKNQDYLSASTLKDYRSSYGDSLKGFDEAKIKAELLTKGVFGSEYNSYIKVLKRRYINDKYGIAPKIEYLPQNNPSPVGTQNLPVSGKNIGGGSVINVAPCVNEDFESTLPAQYTTSNAVTGWTVSSMNTNGCNLGPYSPGSSEFWIVSTPILGFPTVGTIPNSPLGGTRVAKLNDFSPTTKVTKLATTFPVTSANSLFQFAFAGYYENPGHGCCDQPGFFVRVLNCSNQILTCSSITLAAGCAAVNATFSTTTNGSAWTNWQVKYIDLTPYIGTCVTFECWNNDCSFGGHYGCTLFDARCGGQLIGSGLSGVGGNIPGPVSFCAGSGLAQISAPLGYASYTWVPPSGSPSIAPSQATLSTITITNPVVNAVYTVNLTSPSGCAFTATNIISQSTLQIVGIGTTTSCINGSSGSATVQGNGSPTGYTYTWTNSSNSVVSSASVASGLLPGMYTVTVGGSGAFCGPPVSTTAQIVTGPQALISLLKPFCNGQAYLNTSGGSNFQWYNGSSAISSTLGGTASGYTVGAPFQGAVYHLSYLSSYGCQDSIKFTLVQSPPGILNVSNVSLICPGGTNGTAVISMTPATGSPPGINSFSVVNSNSTTPAYNASLYPTPSTQHTVTGLAAGSYSVKTFDGSCSYTTAFNVFANVFNFTLTPNNNTLCPGNQMAVGASFSVPVSPGQYTYSWSPSTWLAGGNPNLQNTIVSPTVPIGTSSTVIYTVVATPTLINCPLSKTMAVTMVSPPTPTITPILPSCDNQSPFPVLVSPTGGTFYCVGPTATSPITALGGVITPSLAGLGVNTLTYTIKQNTCTASQTATFEVSHYNPAIITSSISPLCVTNNPVNLMNIVQFTTNGSWSGPGVAGTSFVPGNVSGGAYTLTFATTSSPNIAACPASATISVPVTNTISPNIVQIPPFCTNAAPFNMTVTPSGGVWSNPAINALTGSVNPASAVPSNSIASYTVVIGPCVNVKTTTLTIANYNPATLSTSNIALCAFGNPMNLMSIVSGTSNGSWAGQSVVSNSFNPFQLPTATYSALYTRVSTPINGLCDYTAAVNISVLNPPVPTINQIGPFCSKDAAVQLVVSPGTGTWTGASYLNTSGVFVPSLAAVGNNAVQYVIGTNTCNSQQTKFISVEGFASAALTGKIADQCNTSTPINLLPITQSNQGVWSGPGISGTSFNPGTAGAGNFVLTYNTASSPSGLCPDQSTVAVTVYSLA
ncbi:MAG: hypothetical protein IT236_14515, partial [Bacteroidia bacterium]|nr:hypothetical protein [Bacteroidia bacterium]